MAFNPAHEGVMRVDDFLGVPWRSSCLSELGAAAGPPAGARVER